MTEPIPETPEALRADIDQTRAELVETVQALAARADVKARVMESASDAAERVKQTVRERAQTPVPWAVLAAAAAAIVILVVLRRRSR